MGVAAIDQESCLSWQGLRCEICYRECPVRSEAITVENHPRGVSGHALFVPLVHASACTGCGICEKACPTDVPAIQVVPPELVKGRMGAHYRIGNAGGPAALQPAGSQPRPADEVPGLKYLNEERP